MRIKCAAIRYNGVVYEGESHSEIGLRMIREGVCDAPYPIRAGQVKETIHPRKLFSEDLKNNKQ